MTFQIVVQWTGISYLTDTENALVLSCPRHCTQTWTEHVDSASNTTLAAAAETITGTAATLQIVTRRRPTWWIVSHIRGMGEPAERHGIIRWWVSAHKARARGATVNWLVLIFLQESASEIRHGSRGRQWFLARSIWSRLCLCRRCHRKAGDPWRHDWLRAPKPISPSSIAADDMMHTATRIHTRPLELPHKAPIMGSNFHWIGSPPESARVPSPGRLPSQQHDPSLHPVRTHMMPETIRSYPTWATVAGQP